METTGAPMAYLRGGEKTEGTKQEEYVAEHKRQAINQREQRQKRESNRIYQAYAYKLTNAMFLFARCPFFDVNNQKKLKYPI